MKKVLNILTFVTGLSLTVLPPAGADTTQKDNTATTGQYLSSSAITAKVKSALLAKQNIDSTKINVQSETAANNKTIVILTGSQKTHALVDLAGAVARDVAGVTKVINKLTVSN